jgi:hypothetical protein
MTQTYTSGFFGDQQRGSRQSAKRVLPLIMEAIQPSTVIDVGCAEELGSRFLLNPVSLTSGGSMVTTWTEHFCRFLRSDSCHMTLQRQSIWRGASIWFYAWKSLSTFLRILHLR